jgi:hypothetical protein
MKNLSFMNIHNARKWALPTGIVGLGLVSVLASQVGNGNSKASITDTTSTSTDIQANESPAPTATPNITVNGITIPTDKAGSHEVAIPGGKAHVEVSGGHTQITTSNSGKGGDTSNKQSGNVDINVRSQTNGGTNWGTTQVYGFDTSLDNSSSSFSSTSIFSSGNSDVNVTK